MNWLYPFYAFLISLTLLYGGRHLALRYNFVDKPGGRKKHTDAIPPIGGLVIIPVFIGGMVASGMAVQIWPLICALGVLLLMGGLDDAFYINPWVKFFIQVAVACFVVVFMDAEIAKLGHLLGLGQVELGYAAKPFAAGCLVLLMNAVNMIDGLDGLAGGVVVVALTLMFFACAIAGAPDAIYLILMLLGPVAAFLFFNMRHRWREKASVFLGDSGSLCLGLVLGWLCIYLTQSPQFIMKPIAVAWIIALPIMDLLVLFIVRPLRGRHAFMPDRGHLHHRLVDQGIPVRRSVVILLSLSFLLGLTGVLGDIFNIPEVSLFLGWLSVFALHTYVALHPRILVRFLRRPQGA